MQFIVMFLGAAALLGASVSLMVSRSLAASVGLTGPSRYLLAAGISFGVISVAVKSLIALSVSSNMGAFHIDPSGTERAPGMTVEKPGTPAPGYKPWEALTAPPRAPAGNAVTPERAALGKRLFHDTRLSADGEVSCASCHKLSDGGDDNRATSIGIDGLTGDRNAPTVINAAFHTRFFWDGRAVSLEDQAKGPLVNPVEMAMPSLEAVVEVVTSDAEYPELFRQAYGEDRQIDADMIAQALASYERTLYATDTAYDRFVRGDETALTGQQQYGMLLFDRLGCRTCHADPTFSARDSGLYRRFPVFPDSAYVARYSLAEDKGRLPDNAGDARAGLWRVPSLRDVARTAPYFHNGSVETLDEAVRIMAAVQLNYTIAGTSAPFDGPEWDADSRRMSGTPPQSPGPEEIDALVAFLQSLSMPEEEEDSIN